MNYTEPSALKGGTQSSTPNVVPDDKLFIEQLTAALEQRDMKIAEMEGDILTTVEIIAGVLHSLGINPADFSGTGEPGDLMKKIGYILPKITMQFATGSFDGQAIQNVSALMPVFEKYKYLTENINLPENEQG